MTDCPGFPGTVGFVNVGLFAVLRPEEPGKVGHVDCHLSICLLFAHSAEEWIALDLRTSVHNSRYNELTLFMLQIFIEQNSNRGLSFQSQD